MNTAQTQWVVVIQDREKPVTMGLPRSDVLGYGTGRDLVRSTYQRWCWSMAFPDLDRAASL